MRDDQPKTRSRSSTLAAALAARGYLEPVSVFPKIDGGRVFFFFSGTSPPGAMEERRVIYSVAPSRQSAGTRS